MDTHTNAIRRLDSPTARSDSRQLTLSPETSLSLVEIEQLIVALWAELLEIDKTEVGRHANFFELGGYSLLATRATWRIREIFRVNLPLSDFFEAGNVAQLAVRIQHCAEPTTATPPLLPQSHEDFIPASYAQERLWLLDKTTSVGAAYNVSVAFHLSGALDVNALERSLTEIARRHDCLRTHFGELDGVPYQVVDPPSGFPLYKADLSISLDSDERDSQLTSCVQREQLHKFDLSKGPLTRVTLVRLAETQHVFVMAMHHIVVDGWSLAILIGELSDLYTAFSQEMPSPLREVSLQYADYAVWERSWLKDDVLDKEIRYWRARLEGAPAFLDLPTDRPRPREPTYSGSSVPLELPVALCEAVDTLSRREKVTMFMVFLAAYQVLLSRYTGQKDIVVGAPIAGRPHEETDGLIGFFVNTLILRTDLSGTLTVRDLLQRVKEVTLGAYAHQYLPFDKLVMELRPERNLGRQPIFQVMIALQNFPKARLELTGLKWTRMSDFTTTSKFDLILHLFDVSESLFGEQTVQTESSEQLCGAWEYSTELFEQETIERMSEQFRILLKRAVADPDRLLA